MDRRDVLKISLTATAAPALMQLEAAPAAWTPQVFTATQNEMVIALTEAIIPATDTPGAKAAKVNQYIDRFLAAGPDTEKQRFLSGLAWLDKYSQGKFQQPFAKLSSDQQTQVLTALDAHETPETAEGYRFFRMAKQMTARIFYQTEQGYQDLNRGSVPATFACSHDAHQR